MRDEPMLGIGLHDYSCERPNSIRVVKSLGKVRQLLGLVWLVHCVDGAHSKQLVFRIRELLEYGHHTRDRWGRSRAPGT